MTNQTAAPMMTADESSCEVDSTPDRAEPLCCVSNAVYTASPAVPAMIAAIVPTMKG